MPIRDVEVMNVMLAATFGPDRATIAPATWELALWVGDLDDGVEQDGPGYARAAVDSDDFPAYAALTDGSTELEVTFADATAEWPDDATHWVMIDPSGNFGPYGELPEPLEVTGAGSFPPVLIELFFDDTVEYPD